MKSDLQTIIVGNAAYGRQRENRVLCKFLASSDETARVVWAEQSGIIHACTVVSHAGESHLFSTQVAEGNCEGPRSLCFQSAHREGRGER